MILAAAQTHPLQGDIPGNLHEHYRLLKLASDNGADLIVFPEMSITGYARENAARLSFTEDDSRLDRLRTSARDNNVIAVAGAPIRIGSELFIGAFVLYPDGTSSIYIKQFLHSGEEDFFESSFEYNPIIDCKGERITLAICADIENTLHPENAHNSKTTIYTASIFYTAKSISKAHTLLSSYAEKYSMNVLMANYSGKSWGLQCGGRSAFWNKNGDVIAELDDGSSGLLLVEKDNDCWKEKS